MSKNKDLLKHLVIGMIIGIGASFVYYWNVPLYENRVEIRDLKYELRNVEEKLNYLENEIKALNLYNRVTGDNLSLDSSDLYKFPCISLTDLTEEEIEELISCQEDGYSYFKSENDELIFLVRRPVKSNEILMGDEEYIYDPDKSYLENFRNNGVHSIDKPVIYIYGAYNAQKIKVSLDTDSEIFCEYPKRDKNGVWEVSAFPNGNLILNNDNKLIYNYLYWEAKCDDIEFDFSKGYCVKGSESAEFLENILDDIGLSREEANEFIVYWLPKLESNTYNLISFQTDVYTDEFKLNIEPKTSNVLRLFMAFKGLDSPVEIEGQDVDELSKGFERHGLHIVEWGGSEVK